MFVGSSIITEKNRTELRPLIYGEVKAVTLRLKGRQR